MCGSGHDEQVRKLLKEILNGSGTVEIEIKRKDGSLFFADFDTSSFVVKNDLPYVIIIRDITERKKIEKERLDKQKLEGVIELAGAACHEINQPLQVISGYAEYLLSVDVLDQENKNQ